MIIRYILSFLFSFIVSVIGSYFSNQGLPWYYTQIKRPRWTPSGKVIGSVWTALFILAAFSGETIWNLHPANATTFAILFFINGLLNITWSYVFFFRHQIRAGIVVSSLLFVSVLSIIIPATRVSHNAAWLLVPYAAWAAFATFLNYSIARLNPRKAQ